MADGSWVLDDRGCPQWRAGGASEVGAAGVGMAEGAVAVRSSPWLVSALGGVGGWCVVTCRVIGSGEERIWPGPVVVAEVECGVEGAARGGEDEVWRFFAVFKGDDLSAVGMGLLTGERVRLRGRLGARTWRGRDGGQREVIEVWVEEGGCERVTDDGA